MKKKTLHSEFNATLPKGIINHSCSVCVYIYIYILINQLISWSTVVIVTQIIKLSRLLWNTKVRNCVLCRSIVLFTVIVHMMCTAVNSITNFVSKLSF
jgi:hypothetical protein